MLNIYYACIGVCRCCVIARAMMFPEWIFAGCSKTDQANEQIETISLAETEIDDVLERGYHDWSSDVALFQC